MPSSNYVIRVKDRFNCLGEKGFALTNPPAIQFSLGRDTLLPYGDTLRIVPSTNLKSTDIRQVNWQTNPMQNPCTTCTNFYTYKPTEDHTLKATVESITGCKVSDEISVFIDLDFKVFIPNIFQPNNAINPDNQILMVSGGRQINKINYFRIFNRYGDQVYEARDFLPNDRSMAWDGRFKNEDAGQGVYVYLAEAVFEDGKARVIKGDVVLMR